MGVTLKVQEAAGAAPGQAQPWAARYASMISLFTRPRSETV